MPLLSVSGVHKQYATTHAVNDINFSVEPGEIFALLGPNGAGKTSTVRMLIGLTEPDRGQIAYQSKRGELAQIPAEELGYLPEERGLYQDQKIIDVLIYLAQLRGVRRSDARAAALPWLERFGLADRAKEKVSALSKGNQQKVQLIAALQHQPRMLVLDEPFSGLDPVNQEMVLELLRELRSQGTTILLSAHQMALVERLADRILLMNRGRRVLFGSMSELRAASGLALSLRLEYSGPAPTIESLRQTGVVDVQADGENNRQLILASDAALNDLLRRLGEGPTLRSVHSEAIGLHDIYLRAVGNPYQEAAR
ncbi:ATP-binding cassette domain-containing protein [Permianibacter sp. IMCC34836]|uniref:ABC transporter ATP-binding protein n=1 Tax=Permianibacter fluminis TaxID=2738515 RepID=UPI0015549E80|nr:ATP-binding cassette domain-containing protein [Permianibacter fluminis]NQD37269.1 ATP-binding cassette domain-containing protein [Permianibacter fluminis]